MSAIWPREHGAYGQAGFPLLTALVLADVAVASVLIALAVVGVFLAHEPMQVLLGARGARARREHGRQAIRWSGIWVALAVIAGAAGLVSMSPAGRWTVVWPVVPAVIVLVAAVRGREKTTVPEVGAAAALSLAAVPVCLAGGLDGRVAAAVGAVYAVTFALMTLAVRVVVLTMRAGAQGPAAAASRRVVIGAAVVGLCAAVGAWIYGAWSVTVPLALVPGVIVASALAVRPPRATKLRLVGWVLVGTSCAAMAVLIGGLR